MFCRSDVAHQLTTNHLDPGENICIRSTNVKKMMRSKRSILEPVVRDVGHHNADAAPDPTLPVDSKVSPTVAHVGQIAICESGNDFASSQGPAAPR